MRKLRLIKPWALKPVKLRLGHATDPSFSVNANNISCFGPSGDSRASLSRGNNILVSCRVSQNPVINNSFLAKAPFSDVIFASLYHNRIR